MLAACSELLVSHESSARLDPAFVGQHNLFRERDETDLCYGQITKYIYISLY